MESVPPETVPSDWITFTDETASFSISYPNDWEIYQTDDVATAELLEAMSDGIEIDDFAPTLLSVGLPQGFDSFDPNVLINVETLPVETTADEYSTASERVAAEIFKSFETTSETRVRVGEHDGLIVRSSVLLSEFIPEVTDEIRWWVVDLVLVDGKVAWGMTCGTAAFEASEAADRLETCEQVVRSFELLAP